MNLEFIKQNPDLGACTCINTCTVFVDVHVQILILYILHKSTGTYFTSVSKLHLFFSSLSSFPGLMPILADIQRKHYTKTHPIVSSSFSAILFAC